MKCYSIFSGLLQTFKDLVDFSPSFSQVAAVFQRLVSLHPHLAWEPLSIRDLPEFQAVYVDKIAEISPAKEDSNDARHVSKSKFRRDPPYQDPFDTVEPIPSNISIKIPDDYDPVPLAYLIRTLRQSKEDILEPTIHLRSLAHDQDGTMETLDEAKGFVEEYNVKHPTNPKVAVYSLRTLSAAYERMESSSLKQDCCTGGHFGLILRLMGVEPGSPIVQVAGLEAFFLLLGAYGMDETLPTPPTVKRGKANSKRYREVVMATISSICTAPGHADDLRVLFEGVRCIARWYHSTMVPDLKR